jgi:hypothetical protein
MCQEKHRHTGSGTFECHMSAIVASRRHIRTACAKWVWCGVGVAVVVAGLTLPPSGWSTSPAVSFRLRGGNPSGIIRGMSGRTTGPVFAGVHALLTMIRDLSARPRFFGKPPDQDLRGERPLPLVCLRRESGRNGLLKALSERLDHTGMPQVPHVLVDTEAAEEQSGHRWGSPESQRQAPLLPLLDELCRELARKSFGTKRLTRFDRYRLADWLTGRDVPPAQRRDDRARMAQLLRQWIGGHEQPNLAPVVDAAPGWPAKLVMGFALWAWRKVGYRWATERVPGLGRETRWFMRQQFMVPRHSVGFLDFAERLTAGRRDSENEEQLKRLLVHAFLEDLRVAYRRRRFGVLPRRPGWRRTAYLTILLDNVTAANGGWELLRLVNAVRNETGEIDPLLIVVESDETPPLEDPPRPVSPAETPAALNRWQRMLPSRRQLLADNARYLLVTLPPAADDEQATGLQLADQNAWDTDGSFRPGREPVLARRGVVETIVVLVLLGGLTPVALGVASYHAAGCSFTSPLTSGAVAVRPFDRAPGDRECVGYSDNAAQVFGSDERLRNAQTAVFEQNANAQQQHLADPDRPFVSLVYFGGLTHNGVDPNTDHSLAEELEGMLLRQRVQNDQPSKISPLLRVIVANGGAAMGDAAAVVRDMLAPLFRSDPTILGVIGMDRTVTQTQQAIAELGLLGMPAVGTTLTGVGLTDLSPLYFQLSPDNDKEAVLVTEYAKHVRATKVTIYQPQLGGDAYVQSLAGLLAKRLGDNGITIENRLWNGSVSALSPLCAQPGDHSHEIAFFDGRDNDFGDFLRTATNGCYQPQQLPRILGDDAVSRFIEHERDRTQDSLAGIPVSYVSLASLTVLAGQPCVHGHTGSVAGGGSPLDAFCSGYGKLRDSLVDTLPKQDAPLLPWPGERVGQSYDAAGLFIEAVQKMQNRAGRAGQPYAPNPGAVAQQFREQSFSGATGAIEFASSRGGDNRNLAILTITDIHDLNSPPTCVYLIGNLYDKAQRRDANGCPA